MIMDKIEVLFLHFLPSRLAALEPIMNLIMFFQAMFLWIFFYEFLLL